MFAYSFENPIIKMNKRLAIQAILLLFFSTSAFSNSSPKNCSLSGIVTDSLTGEGLPFASVQLFTATDSVFVSGSITDINGQYNIKDLAEGEYSIVASYMGYNNSDIIVSIQNRKNLVNINLQQKKFSLSEIEVSDKKSMVENTIEKTTINVSRSSINKIGTTMDIIQTLPSVDVDFDGNINYRGSNKVIILINGEKSELINSLDQIPADQVEKIELINNPSAKYDAEGMSGIINIVLKSGSGTNNKKSLMLFAGYPETAGANAGINVMKKKASYFANVGIDHKTKFQTKEHLRENYEDPTAHNYYQYDRQDAILNTAFLNTGLEYSINKNQHIGFSIIGSTKFNSADRSINYETLDEKDSILQESTKDIDIALNNYSIDGNLSYNYNFKKENQTLTTNLHYSVLDQENTMDNNYYNDLTTNYPELQNTASDQLNKEVVASIDYSHPMGKKLTIETGYNYNNKNLLNNFSSESYSYNSGTWKNDTALNNKFNYIQQINALYFNVVTEIKQFEIQAGIRSELTNNSQNKSNRKEYIDFFPSVNISRKITKKLSLFTAFSRRINRPTIKMLNPFTAEYADQLNMHIGNPNLEPEYVNSVEMGYRFTTDYLSGTGSVYYRNIDQAISRIKFASNDSALVVTFINLDNATLVGGDFSLSGKPAKWWSINVNASVFHTTMTGIYGNNIINRNSIGWNAKITNKFKLPAGFGFQMIGYYRSKLPDVMGTYQEKYYMDIALNKKIMKDKGQLIFKVSDLFNTYKYGLDLDAIDDNGYRYKQFNRRKNESQYFTLSFIYNIEGKEKQKKKTNFYLEGFDK